MAFEFFKDFPVEMMGNIWQWLPYQASQNLRQTHSSLNNSFLIKSNQDLMAGPIPAVTINHVHDVYFTNDRRRRTGLELVNVCCEKLTVEFTAGHLPKLKNIMDTWKVKKMVIRNNIINREFLRYLNNFSKDISIITRTFTEISLYLPNVTSIEISEPIMFFNMKTLMKQLPNLKTYKVSLTIAGLCVYPKILQEYWKDTLELIEIKMSTEMVAQDVKYFLESFKYEVIQNMPDLLNIKIDLENKSVQIRPRKAD